MNKSSETLSGEAGRLLGAAIGSAQDILDRMKSSAGLTDLEAETFVALLHKLDRIRLAEVSGYALGLAMRPRCTVIDPDHWALRSLSQNEKLTHRRE